MSSSVVMIDGKGNCLIERQRFPAVGFGTYPLTGKSCEEALEHAVTIGYRIIDTATFYQNFLSVGVILNRHGRKNYYLISKVWPDSQAPTALKADLYGTLKELRTGYLDAYLLHWPNSRIPIEDSLGTMEELRQQGLIRHIGVSNFTINHLKRASECGIPFVWNQVEMGPQFYEPDLLTYCKKEGIAIQAWAPLAKGRLANDTLLRRIGTMYGKTPSQVAIRWIFQKGAVPLPSSRNPQHIQDNFNVMDFALTQQQMDEISTNAEKGRRERYGFDEFDYTYEECWPQI